MKQDKALVGTSQNPGFSGLISVFHCNFRLIHMPQLPSGAVPFAILKLGLILRIILYVSYSACSPSPRKKLKL
jgi:hypothetical protein